MATMNARQRVADSLLGSLGLRNQNPYSNYRPNVMDPLGISTPAIQRGAGNFRYGVNPSMTDLNAYVDSVLGRQKLNYGRQTGQRTGGMGGFGAAADGADAMKLARESGIPPESPLFERLVASFQSKIDEANAANIKRYDEGHAELSDLRTRNQGRVQNWGVAAQADIDDRMQKALGDQRAALASRGLQDASLYPAFIGDVAQRTAREQQRVSEMRDSRASEYDTRDTGNLVGFVERRNDVAPDYGQLLNLAMQYGQSGQGQGLEAVRDEIAGLKRDAARRRYQPMTQLPRMPGPVTPPPIFLGPQALGFPTGAGYMTMGPNTSNRYPTPRGTRQGKKKKSKKGDRSRPQILTKPPLQGIGVPGPTQFRERPMYV